MKGLSMPEDIGMTLIFLIVLVVLAIMIVFIQIMIKFPVIGKGQAISYSVDFVTIVNKPFMIADVLAQEKIGDRQMLEQSIETATAGSLENASATNLPRGVVSFLNSYKSDQLKSYSISINNKQQIVEIDDNNFKCGENDEGWCVFDGCDTGRIEISGKCPAVWQKCCKEDRQAYAQANPGTAIVSCGTRGEGVCSKGVKKWPWSNPQCTQSRIDLGLRPECNKDTVNSGGTLVCCAPDTEENAINAGIAAKATVPLLFKQYYGTLEVTVQ